MSDYEELDIDIIEDKIFNILTFFQQKMATNKFIYCTGNSENEDIFFPGISPAELAFIGNELAKKVIEDNNYSVKHKMKSLDYVHSILSCIVNGEDNMIKYVGVKEEKGKGVETYFSKTKALKLLSRIYKDGLQVQYSLSDTIINSAQINSEEKSNTKSEDYTDLKSYMDTSKKNKKSITLK